MEAEIKLSYAKQPLKVKESFATLKKRLYDNQPFFDVTIKKGSKLVVAKKIVDYIEVSEKMK